MKVAMLLHKDVAHDSRVLREAGALREAGHEVTVVDLPKSPRRLPFSLHRVGIFWSLLRRCLALRPDVVHAHDVAMLAPGWLASRLRGCALVYDTHELARGVPYRSRLWALYVRVVERLLIGSADAVIAVSDGIAARLEEMYGLGRTPVVVRNVCGLPRPSGAAAGLRERVGVPGAPIVLHQGAIGRDRGAGVLIEAVSLLPDANLVFLGATDDEIGVAAARHGVSDRVHTLPPEPLDTLLDQTSGADVGLSLLQDTCENHRLALPNKVFEYLAAGVPVVASDLPELRRLLGETRAGTVVPPADPPAVAAGIAEVLAEGSGVRERAAEAGRDLTWEREAVGLTGVYERLAAERGQAPPPTAVVLVRNAATHDARVLRTARTLRAQGERALVVAVTTTAEAERAGTVDGVPVLRLDPASPLRPLRRHLSRGSAGEPQPAASTGTGRSGSITATARLRRWLVTLDYYRLAIAALRRWRPRIVHCNDYNTMWPGIAAKLLWGAGLVYDSHELWPDRNGRTEPRRWLVACEALFVRLADEVVTTSPGHAEEISRRYRVSRPLVVRNVPAPASAEAAGDSASRALVYAGAVTGGRGLEQAIAALSLTSGAHLRIVGPGSEDYRARLVALADEAGVADRVTIAAPVAPATVVDEIAGAAAGLALIQPVCRSYELSLPNKVFEYLAAGLPILASDLAVIGPLVKGEGLGLAVPPSDLPAIAAAMEELLDPARNAELRVSVARARDRISIEAEQERMAGAHRSALASAGG